MDESLEHEAYLCLLRVSYTMRYAVTVECNGKSGRLLGGETCYMPFNIALEQDSILRTILRGWSFV